MNGSSTQHLKPNLHLNHPLELVDPDIGQTNDGQWRIGFFAVRPSEMDTVQFGPMAAAKPHKFFRTVGTSLESFPTPDVIVAFLRRSLVVIVGVLVFLCLLDRVDDASLNDQQIAHHVALLADDLILRPGG